MHPRYWNPITYKNLWPHYFRILFVFLGWITNLKIRRLNFNGIANRKCVFFQSLKSLFWVIQTNCKLTFFLKYSFFYFDSFSIFLSLYRLFPFFTTQKRQCNRISFNNIGFQQIQFSAIEGFSYLVSLQIAERCNNSYISLIHSSCLRREIWLAMSNNISFLRNKFGRVRDDNHSPPMQISIHLESEVITHGKRMRRKSEGNFHKPGCLYNKKCII